METKQHLWTSFIQAHEELSTLEIEVTEGAPSLAVIRINEAGGASTEICLSWGQVAILEVQLAGARAQMT